MIEIGINPIFFTIGSVSVGWYGIFIALAIAVPLLAYRTQWVKRGEEESEGE